MVDGLFLAAIPGVAVEVQQQASHSLRQDADTGIYHRHLHGAPLGDDLAGSVAAPGGTILGSVPRMEQTAEKPIEITLLNENGQKKSAVHSWKADGAVV